MFTMHVSTTSKSSINSVTKRQKLKSNSSHTFFLNGSIWKHTRVGIKGYSAEGCGEGLCASSPGKNPLMHRFRGMVGGGTGTTVGGIKGRAGQQGWHGSAAGRGRRRSSSGHAWFREEDMREGRR